MDERRFNVTGWAEATKVVAGMMDWVLCQLCIYLTSLSVHTVITALSQCCSFFQRAQWPLEPSCDLWQYWTALECPTVLPMTFWLYWLVHTVSINKLSNKVLIEIYWWLTETTCLGVEGGWPVSGCSTASGRQWSTLYWGERDPPLPKFVYSQTCLPCPHVTHGWHECQ